MLLTSLRHRRSDIKIHDHAHDAPLSTRSKRRRRKGDHRPTRRVIGSLVVCFTVYICKFLFVINKPPQLFPLRALALVPYQAHPLMIEFDTGAAVNPTSGRLLKSKRKRPWRHENEQVDIPSVDGCEYRDWHYNQTFMQCNSMHELRMVGDDSLQFIACGGSRCVFRLSNDFDHGYLALKVERYHAENDSEEDEAVSHSLPSLGTRQITETVLKQHRKDSMVMERLTASPYVPNIYTACGSSQLVEYADNGNLHDLIKVARQSGEDNMSSVDKLRIAVQVAEGTAAIHSFEKDGVASLSHNDLDCQQFVLCDGVFKINDFHWAELIPKNQTSNEMCRMYNKDLFDEHYYKTRPLEAFDFEDRVDLTKIDTHSLGNVMWYLLTNRWMFEGEHVKRVRKRIKRGERPHFPVHINQSKDPAIKAIKSAIISCWTHDPDERPTSTEIRDFLRHALQSITGETGVVRVSVPPLPKDHRYTDSDYYQSLLW